MKIKGMKGLHEICKANGAGLSMPDETAVGENIQVVLKVSPSTTKADLRTFLNTCDKESGIINEAKVEVHRDLA